MSPLPARDVAVAAVLTAMGQAEVWLADADGSRLPSAALVFVATASVGVRSRYPVLAALTVSAFLAAVSFIGVSEPDVLAELLALVLVVYTVGAVTNTRTTVRATAACLLLVWLGVAASETNNAGSFVFTAIAVATPALAGCALRQQEAQADTLEADNRRLAAEREQAVVEERERIARELHDVVAHGLSVIVIQAAAAARADDLAVARAALVEIERVGRDGYEDMQRMVGVLREPGPAQRAPQPGLDDLERLVESMRRRGQQVELTNDLAGVRLGPSAELALYRIAQEAVTNAVKHAGDAPIRVDLRRASEGVVLVVHNAAGRTSPTTDLRGGRGIAGMQERAAVFGGRLVAGPQPGGFTVEATLPL